ncbi:MAG: tail fiber protein [Pseudomonadota bacterium]
MSSPFVAEIRAFSMNFAPKGWAFCDGQLLPISQNTALFSLLGTMYGGDGKSTFALPDLQGNAPISKGPSSTGTQYDQGQTGGTEFVTLLESEMPAHTHNIMTAPGDTAETNVPAGNVLARAGLNVYSTTLTPLQQMNFQALQVGGGGLPHNNMMPYLTLNFCIAMQGVFPPRS